MIRFNGTVSGATAAIAHLNKLNDNVLNAVERGTRRGMLGGQSIVRGNASGRPGPRAPTGDYRRSIVGDAERVGDTVYGQIGTNAAQGPRLEFGFFGPDALGRVYAQPPFEHFQPSVPGVIDLTVNQIVTELQRALQ